jgi:hypothetical protein
VRLRKALRIAEEERVLPPMCSPRDFTAAAPNQRWVSDTTEFLIGDGAKLYLAPIVDLFSPVALFSARRTKTGNNGVEVGGCMQLKSGVIVSAFDSLKVLFEPFEDRFHSFICPLPIHVEVYAVF